MPGEKTMYRYQMPVFVKQYNLVCANLGFNVHNLCDYCEMVAIATGNKVSKHLEARLEELQVKDEFNVLVRTNIFQWFPASPTYSHLGTVSSHDLYCMGTC